MDETVNCSEVGKTCHYSSTMANGHVVCDYIGLTGHSRRCKPEACDKYKLRSESKAKMMLNKSLNDRMGGYPKRYFDRV